MDLLMLEAFWLRHRVNKRNRHFASSDVVVYCRCQTGNIFVSQSCA